MKTKEFDSAISARIKWLREIKNYTQEELASVLSITTTAYGKIELGYNRLSLENCALLAKFYGTTCDFIINGTYETNAVMFLEANLKKASKMLADLDALLSNAADRAIELDVKPTEEVTY